MMQRDGGHRKAQVRLLQDGCQIRGKHERIAGPGCIAGEMVIRREDSVKAQFFSTPSVLDRGIQNRLIFIGAHRSSCQEKRKSHIPSSIELQASSSLEQACWLNTKASLFRRYKTDYRILFVGKVPKKLGKMAID